MIFIALGQVVTAKTRIVLPRIAETWARSPEDFTDTVEIPITRLPIGAHLSSVARVRNRLEGGLGNSGIGTGAWLCYRSAIGLRLSGMGFGDAPDICEDLMKLLLESRETTELPANGTGEMAWDGSGVVLMLNPEGWAWDVGIEYNLPGSVTTGAWTVAPQSIALGVVRRSVWLDWEIDGAGLLVWLELARGRVVLDGGILAALPESLQIAWGICDRLLGVAEREGWPIALDLPSLERLMVANPGTVPLIEGLLSWSDGLLAGARRVGVGDRAAPVWVMPMAQRTAIASGIDLFYRGLPIAGAVLRGDVALRSAQLALFEVARAWLVFGVSAIG